MRWCIPGEAPKIALLILFEERDVPQLEFLSLLGIVADYFSRILSNPQEIVMVKSPMARSSSRASTSCPNFTKYSGTSASTGNCFVVAGSALRNPSSICCRRGKSLSDPLIFVGLVFVANAIVCPMAVIALDTLPAWICFPLP